MWELWTSWTKSKNEITLFRHELKNKLIGKVFLYYSEWWNQKGKCINYKHLISLGYLFANLFTTDIFTTQYYR